MKEQQYEREVPGKDTLTTKRSNWSKEARFLRKHAIVLPRKGGVGHDAAGWYITYLEGGEQVKEPIQAADVAEALAIRDRRHVELQMTRDATYGGTRDGTATKLAATVGSHGRPRGRRTKVKEEDAIVAYDTIVTRYRVFFGGRLVRDVDTLAKARSLLARCNKRLDPLSRYARKCAACGKRPRTGEVNGVYFVCHEEADCENRIFLRQGQFKTGVLLAAWNELLYDKAGQERWRLFQLRGGMKAGRAPKNFQFPDGWRPPEPLPLRRRKTRKALDLEARLKAGGGAPDEYGDAEDSMPADDDADEGGPGPAAADINIDDYEP